MVGVLSCTRVNHSWPDASTRRGHRRAITLVIALALSACVGSDEAEAPTSAVGTAVRPSDVAAGDGIDETRTEIGPRALDVDDSMLMVVDSFDAADDEVFVRVRVVNGSNRFLNVEAEANLYGPLLVIRDDRGNMYRSRAVEPAGVDVYSIGKMRFRLDGPLDTDAKEFVVELATSRGALATDPIPVPEGRVVRWSTESPPLNPLDVVGARTDRSVRVVEIVDRGTHLDVSVEARDDATGFSFPDDLRATLTLPDGTEIESLPVVGSATGRSDEFNAVLRFLGGLSNGSGTVSLATAGVAIEIPLDGAGPDPSAPESLEPAIAAPPRLPDLLHFDVHPEPLPMTTPVR